MEDKFRLLEELTKLHKEATTAIALMELYNEGNKSYPGLHNELRNAFSHVMDMINARDNKDRYNEEFERASSHLKRAIMDAYELVCLNCNERMTNLLKPYDSEDVIKVFPTYYSEIKPEILGVNQIVAEKKEDKRNEELLSSFRKDVYRLMGYYKEMEKGIPHLIELKKERAKKQFFQVKIPIFIGILGLLSGFVFFILGKR